MTEPFENAASINLLHDSTIIIAIGLPIYAKFALGDVWLSTLPAFLRLLITNTVVLAVLLAVVLHVGVNVGLGEDESGGSSESKNLKMK